MPRNVCSVLVTAAVALAIACAGVSALAGPQQYEPLSDAMRSALAAAVRDDGPVEARFDSVLDKVEWLAALSPHLPRRWKPEHRQRMDFLAAVRYEARRAGLEPSLVLGLIEVESAFRRYAISSAGARGYMQVMPFWTGVIGDGDPAKLFDMRANLRYGCTILRHYLDIERGNLFRALGRYNGSLGRAEYPNLVLRSWKRWEERERAGMQAGARQRALSAQAPAFIPVSAPAAVATPAPAATSAPTPSASAPSLSPMASALLPADGR